MYACRVCVCELLFAVICFVLYSLVTKKCRHLHRKSRLSHINARFYKVHRIKLEYLWRWAFRLVSLPFGATISLQHHCRYQSTTITTVAPCVYVSVYWFHCCRIHAHTDTYTTITYTHTRKLAAAFKLAQSNQNNDNGIHWNAGEEEHCVEAPPK